ncbi:LAMI_0H15610g1_1 [Lachancea mirantina]|uniref:LAMI_0H15610g1_1 n=1 Tax=Lachancea mirantina TaxID=1230905 RepID=A0A1G4KIN7_9SACH|nr:LAMI_0H15610g1_1 [Lachancea mirantina]
MDPYDTLGVDSSATQDEIRRAYRRLALQHHPDKVSDESLREKSEIRFKEIAAAYELLSDEQRRRNYDLYGQTDGEPGMSFGEDDFASFFQQFNQNGYDEPAAGTQRATRTPDVHVTLKLTMQELFNGRTIRFQAKRDVVCPKCHGEGCRKKAARNLPACESCGGQGVRQNLRRVGPGFVTRETVKCERCRGTGRVIKPEDRCRKCHGNRTVSETKPLSVYVPRGSRHGDKIVLDEQADEEPGKSVGNLVFDIEEDASSSNLERRGDDLYTELTVSLAEALGGFERDVCKTLDDRALRLSVPAGRVIRPGNYVRFPKEGWPLDDNGRKFGDLYVQMHIQFPPDFWFTERADVQTLQNILPQVAKPSFDADQSNTETVQKFDVIESANDLPHYLNEENDAQGPQCAQQ